MGLSNEERQTKMYWAVHNIATTIRKLRPSTPGDDLWPHEKKWEHLFSLGDKAWHALLEGSRHGAFWILGGSMSNAVKDPNSPWAVMVSAQCDEVRQGREDKRFYGPKGKRDLDEVCYDPFKHDLGLRGLVMRSGPHTEGERRARLLDTYNAAEFLAYGLRRYDDDFKRGYQELDKLISDILGACFDLMHKDTAFGKAYVGERLLRAIYGQWDTQLWHALNAANMHFWLSSFMSPRMELEDVIAFDKWRVDHKDTPQNRLVLALRIAGSNVHSDRDMKTLIKETRGLSILEATIQREFAKNRKLHKQDEAERASEKDADMDEYSTTAQRAENAVVHGYDFDWDR